MGKIVTWITKIVNQAMKSITIDIKQELMELKLAIKEQDKKIDQNEKDRIRYEILDFANSCHNGRNHTRDEFEHIIIPKSKWLKFRINSQKSDDIQDISHRFYREFLPSSKYNLKEIPELEYYHDDITDFLVAIY